jgi:hypothetical protein
VLKLGLVKMLESSLWPSHSVSNLSTFLSMLSTLVAIIPMDVPRFATVS